MELEDLEKNLTEDTLGMGWEDKNDQTTNRDMNGEVTHDSGDKFQQNQWQFSDEGKSTQECFTRSFTHVKLSSQDAVVKIYSELQWLALAAKSSVPGTGSFLVLRTSAITKWRNT